MSTPAEITVTVRPDVFTDVLTASWDDPSGGGFTTQGKTVAELAGQVSEAAHAHFGGNLPLIAMKFDFTINVR